MFYVFRLIKEIIRIVKWKFNVRNRLLDNFEYNVKCCKFINYGGICIYYFYNVILDLGYELRFFIIDKLFCFINKYFNYILLL